MNRNARGVDSMETGSGILPRRGRTRQPRATPWDRWIDFEEEWP